MDIDKRDISISIELCRHEALFIDGSVKVDLAHKPEDLLESHMLLLLLDYLIDCFADLV
jgi:hypothetical protein